MGTGWAIGVLAVQGAVFTCVNDVNREYKECLDAQDREMDQ